MRYLNGWHPFESIRFDLVKITMWRCLILQIWEQQKQLLLNQRVIQQHIFAMWTAVSVHGAHSTIPCHLLTMHHARIANMYIVGIAVHEEAGNESELEIITPDLFTNYSKTTLQKTK